MCLPANRAGKRRDADEAWSEEEALSESDDDDARGSEDASIPSRLVIFGACGEFPVIALPVSCRQAGWVLCGFGTVSRCIS